MATGVVVTVVAVLLLVYNLLSTSAASASCGNFYRCVSSDTQIHAAVYMSDENGFGFLLQIS